MGIRKWFNKQQERTPSGSPIIRSTPKETQDIMGFPEQDPSAFRALREEVYEAFFGEPETVSHELLPLVPHIDVFVYPPGHANRPFYTLASSGMSDVPMPLPEGLDRSHARREIILYCETPDDTAINLVRHMARFPSEYSTWLDHGHTIPNGDPPAPIFDGSVLSAVLFLYTIVRPDNQLADQVVLDGDPVHFLWLVPITQAELDHKLNHGCDALLDVFDTVKHPVVLDRQRASYL